MERVDAWLTLRDLGNCLGRTMMEVALKSRIRVLQLGSPTGLYGAERWILALIRHLDPSRVECLVASIRDAPDLIVPLCGRADSLGFRTQIFEAPGKFNWSAVRQLRRYIQVQDIQVLHTHGYKTDIIGLMATRGTSCRIVSTPHGWSEQAGLALTVYESIDRAAFPFFDAVVPLSEAIRDGLRPIPGIRSRLHLIRNGVDIAEIDAVQQLSDDLVPWKRAGYFIVGYIGQLIPRKGLALLLKAFARMTVLKKRLVIVGDGPQRQELEALAVQLGIPEQVRFLGFRDDRLEFLKAFDVFVLPSSLEGIPRCLMEAMAAEVAVVASDIPGCKDLVIDGHTGLLFDPNHEESLLSCLDRLTTPVVRDAVARQGREFVVANYSAASMAVQYERLYRSLRQRLPASSE